MTFYYNAYEILCFVDSNSINIPGGKLSLKNTTSIAIDDRFYAVGNTSSEIHLFDYNAIRTQKQEVSFSVVYKRSKNLGYKKPVFQMSFALFKRLIILCDGYLQILSSSTLEPVNSTSRLKALTCFSVYKSSEKSIELFVGSKQKTIFLYSFLENKILCLKEIHVDEVPMNFVSDGDILCVGSWTKYCLCNAQTGSVQELFSLADSTPVKPIVSLVAKGEFLVNGVNNLGIFVSSRDGSPTRAPIQLDSNTIGLACSPPYVVSLSDEFVTVHSLLLTNHQQIQTHSVHNGVALCASRKFLLVACSEGSVQAMSPFPWNLQVEQLLKDDKVSEAMILAGNTADINDESQMILLRKYKQVAGIICLKLNDEKEATQYFIQGRLDPRQLLVLVPGMEPKAEPGFVPNLRIGDTPLPKLDGEHIRPFLLNFLSKYRGTSLAANCQTVVDTALFKLTAELFPDRLESLIYSNLQLDIHEALSSLDHYHRYHSKALLFCWLNRHSEACSLWQTLIVGKEMSDETFPGIKYFVQYLANLDDCDVFWKYAEWVLKENEELGFDVFVNTSKNMDSVIKFLSKFPSSRLKYLELVVLDGNSEVQEHHTLLAQLYLENILAVTDGDKRSDYCYKLRQLLETSDLYLVQPLLSKIKLQNDKDLLYHRAILHSKLNDYETSLSILVHQLQDHDAALEFCRHSKVLLSKLVKIYFDPKDIQRLMTPAVKLLNHPDVQVFWNDVVQLLPAELPLDSLEPFILKSLRQKMFDDRRLVLSRGLTVACLRQTQVDLHGYSSKKINIDDMTVCSVCRQLLNSVSFCLLSDGQVAHCRCSKRTSSCLSAASVASS